jgi:3'(2'), 5'-bisphosphate nucleotidase
MFESYRKEAHFALRAVREAALLCSVIQSERVLPALSKSDRSPVTVADFASQALIASQLHEFFPEDPLVAEEDSQALRQADQADRLRAVVEYVSREIPAADESKVCRWIDRGAGDPAERFWTLDPIDGTKGFLRGDQYVVALALIEAGQVKVGALGCPNLEARICGETGPRGCVLIAVRDEGVWAIGMTEGEPRRIRVSDCDDPKRARMLRSFEDAHTHPGVIHQLGQTMGIARKPILMDSQAKYALLAAGSGEVIFRILSPSRPDYVEKIWDHAAGSLIVEEAGGRMTDLRGKPLNFQTGRFLVENLGVLATNGALHPSALAAIQQVGAHRRPEGL